MQAGEKTGKVRGLRVTALLDGRPGHEKQTRGIIEALSSFTEVRADFIRVPDNPPLADLWAFLRLIVTAQKKAAYSGPDLVIGTGRRTHLPLLQLKKSYGCPAVVCMLPSLLLRNQFDLCLVPRHDGMPENKRFFNTIGPPNTSRSGGSHNPKAGLILIGGKDSSHYWHDEAVNQAVKEIITRENEVDWSVSSSPRTPETTVLMLENLSRNFANCRFDNYQDTPAGWVEEKYAACSKVWVTADSMSMIYEALTAGCEVGLLPVRWKKKNSKFAVSERHLTENKLVLSYDEWKKHGWHQGGVLPPDRPVLNESRRCAKEIIRRWGQKN